jgi:tryptophan-rich sensory protein
MLICDFCVNVVVEFKQKQENETPNCMLLEDMCIIWYVMFAHLGVSSTFIYQKPC